MGTYLIAAAGAVGWLLLLVYLEHSHRCGRHHRMVQRCTAKAQAKACRRAAAGLDEWDRPRRRRAGMGGLR